MPPPPRARWKRCCGGAAALRHVSSIAWSLHSLLLARDPASAVSARACPASEPAPCWSRRNAGNERAIPAAVAVRAFETLSGSSTGSDKGARAARVVGVPWRGEQYSISAQMRAQPATCRRLRQFVRCCMCGAPKPFAALLNICLCLLDRLCLRVGPPPFATSKGAGKHAASSRGMRLTSRICCCRARAIGSAKGFGDGRGGGGVDGAHRSHCGELYDI